MSASRDLGCRCTDGPAPLLPAAVEGEALLSALLHENRAHGWPTAMLRDALARGSRADGPLAPADVGIALVDILASVADVLAHYQDRLANEGYLGTARERTSVRQLARLVGYELQPGLGISAEVAFALETPERDGSVLEVPRGVLVRCAGAKGEPPTIVTTADAVEVHSEWNVLRPRPSAAAEALERNGIPLDRRPEALPSGRLVLVHGTDADTGMEVAEVAIVEATFDSAGVTALTLSSDLHHSYRRASVTIHGNVARATRGDTTVEVLGSGDASVPWQLFLLSHPPFDRALEVRVDGEPWTAVDSFGDAGPDDRVYVVVNAPDGRAGIVFGDGRTGARPPTGSDNVSARYRTGSGPAANVGELSTALDVPAGLEGVRNPVPAGGGADPEQRAEAPANAPASVRALDRLVSLRDHEDFARSFVGVAKASAANLWDGSSPVIHITVAASDGTPPDDESVADLRDAIRAVGDPGRRVVVEPYAPLRFTVRTTLRVDRRRPPADMRAAVVEALAESYSFPRVDFGDVVEARDVSDVIRRVPGVTAVEAVAVRELAGDPRDLAWLAPRPASVVGGRTLPAQLPVFDAATVETSLT